MSVYRGSGHRLDVLVDHAGHLKRTGENRPLQRTGLGAGLVGVVVFVGLYALIAAQQFTRYAQPAGMDRPRTGRCQTTLCEPMSTAFRVRGASRRCRGPRGVPSVT